MIGLISDAEMAGLREVAEAGMVDEVTILTRDVVDGGLEGDTEETFTTTASLTVKGWLWEAPASATGDVVGGEQAIATAYRLYLPVGTPVTNGDRVVIDGAEYNVVGTNAESTYQPVLRLALRRAE